jgi:hypothetical protein
MSKFRTYYTAGLLAFGENDKKTAIAFAKSKCRRDRNPKTAFPPDSYFETEPRRRRTDEEMELASYNRQRK